MKIRVLNPEEYEVLKQAPDGIVPDPYASFAAVALDDTDQLLGRMLVMVIPHLEGPWVREDLRGGIIGARLEQAIVEHMRGLGLKKLMAFAVTDKIEDYLSRIGYKKFPATVWEKEI